MPDFVEGVRRILVETGADARRFDLELTEEILLECSPETLSALAELKSLGFELAIDDFGAGHSSLQYLRNFRWDKIKMDRIFVRQLVEDSSDAAIIHAITSLAHKASSLDWSPRESRPPSSAISCASRVARSARAISSACRSRRKLRLDDRARECAADQPGKQTKSRCPQSAEATMMKQSARRVLKPPKAGAGVRAHKAEAPRISRLRSDHGRRFAGRQVDRRHWRPRHRKKPFRHAEFAQPVADGERAGLVYHIRRIGRPRQKQLVGAGLELRHGAGRSTDVDRCAASRRHRSRRRLRPVRLACRIDRAQGRNRGLQCRIRWH